MPPLLMTVCSCGCKVYEARCSGKLQTRWRTQEERDAVKLKKVFYQFMLDEAMENNYGLASKEL